MSEERQMSQQLQGARTQICGESPGQTDQKTETVQPLYYDQFNLEFNTVIFID